MTKEKTTKKKKADQISLFDAPTAQEPAKPTAEKPVEAPAVEKPVEPAVEQPKAEASEKLVVAASAAKQDAAEKPKAEASEKPAVAASAAKQDVAEKPTKPAAEKPMTKMQRIEADLAKIDREPQKTKLAQKYENDEAKAYANINAAIENAARALKIATLEFEGRDDLNEKEQKACHRELVKNAKAAVKQLEPHNRMHVFIFKSATGTWWKMGGNSVAIHRLMVATYLDHEVNVNVDRDTFAVFRDGVICLQDERRIERDIAYSGAPLKLDDTIEFGPFTGMIKAYRLQKPLAEREVRRFRQLDVEVMKNINNNIFAAAPEVDINNQLVLCLRSGFQLERQVDANARGFVGHQLMDSLWRMRRAYYDVANLNRKDPVRYEAMGRIETALGDAMSTLANYADLNIANRSTISKVSLELAKLREMVSQKIHRFQKRYAVGEKLEELQSGLESVAEG